MNCISPKKPPKKYSDKVLLLKSSTGSGKSTTIPTALYTNFIEQTRKNISITQPRILTCVDIPSSIIQFSDLEFDKNIGYNTGKFQRLPKEKGIIFCTTEIIVQQYMMSETPEEFMSKNFAILVDEVHTRDLGTDRLLFLMKKLLIDHYDDPECPFLILMSATFDEKVFIDYFEIPRENYMIIDGFAYPKTDFYPKYDIVDYNQYAIKKALQIHIENIADIAGKENSPYRDIIIFVPTAAIGQKMVLEFLKYNCTILNQEYDNLITWKEKELDSEVDSLHIKNNNPQVGGDENVIDDNPTKMSKSARFFILPILLSKATFEASGVFYQNLFSPIELISLPIWKLKAGQAVDITAKPDKFVVPSRRIIISTNISETGITIDSLRYCLDIGMEYSVSFCPDFNAPLMMQKGCTQGMIIQRKGRVGRKSPGFWFPCFTEATFNKMQKDQFAEIILSDPIDNLLNIIINETETKIVEYESKTITSNEEKRNALGLFQRNTISDTRWWKLENKKKLNIASMDFIEMPSGPSLQYAIEKLHALGMINDEYNITIFGYYANLIRFIPIEAKRMIFEGFACGASIIDLITATAFIQTGKRPIFDKKYKMPNVLGKPNFDFIYKVLIGDELIGCMLLWNEFNDWMNKKISKAFLQNL
jgi:HrpA-like RNA helicase